MLRQLIEPLKPASRLAVALLILVVAFMGSPMSESYAQSPTGGSTPSTVASPTPPSAAAAPVATPSAMPAASPVATPAPLKADKPAAEKHDNPWSKSDLGGRRHDRQDHSFRNAVQRTFATALTDPSCKTKAEGERYEVEIQFLMRLD